MENSELSLSEIENKLNEFKNNLNKVQMVIDREEDSFNINPDLLKLRDDLKRYVIYYENSLKFLQNNTISSFSTDILTLSNLGKICYAYDEKSGVWLSGILKTIDNNLANVELFENDNDKKQILANLNFKYVKMHETFNEPLNVGMYVETLYYGDGLWYPAVIEQITDEGIFVKFINYDGNQLSTLDAIRISPELKIKNDEKFLNKQNTKLKETISEFKLPDNLKISPADSELQRLAKRKKVKALKNTYKQKIIEKISKEKQDDWLSFMQNAKKNKLNGVKFNKSSIKDDIIDTKYK